jgi:hypothetical protein
LLNKKQRHKTKEAPKHAKDKIKKHIKGKNKIKINFHLDVRR